MIIHEIHDLSNSVVTNLLTKELSNITDDIFIKNYHPDYIDYPGNLFCILKQGRYIKGNYYVIEEDEKYICSAGWNEYELDSNIALMLTRLYIAPEYRTRNYAGTYMLPKALTEVTNYKHVWMTVNEYNKGLYAWFDRASKGKRTGLFHDWPKIYRKFVPIGKRDIYYTEQYVVEYQPNAQ
jgi:GNAT superfamily N-acetyltransferase